MIDMDTALRRLKEALPALRRDHQVASIGFFGSFARGEHQEGSDMDMLVEFTDTITMFQFLRLEDALSDLLGVKVDLVTPDAVRPAIKQSIMRDVIHA